jgi:hypothetical protein
MRDKASIRHGQITMAFTFFMKFLLIREVIVGMEIVVEGYCQSSYPENQKDSIRPLAGGSIILIRISQNQTRWKFVKREVIRKDGS